MISNGVKLCHYLAVKKLSALITPKYYGDFYCLNCLHSLEEKKLESHKEYANIKIFVMYLCLLNTLKY